MRLVLFLSQYQRLILTFRKIVQRGRGRKMQSRLVRQSCRPLTRRYSLSQPDQKLSQLVMRNYGGVLWIIQICWQRPSVAI